MQFFRALISHCNFFCVSATVWHSLQFSHSGWYTVGHDIAQDWITTVSKNVTPWWCSSCKENRREAFAVLSPWWFAEGAPILCARFLLQSLLEKPWQNWAQQQQIFDIVVVDCCWFIDLNLFSDSRRSGSCVKSHCYRQVLCFFYDSYWMRMDQVFFSWQNFQGHAKLPAKVEGKKGK